MGKGLVLSLLGAGSFVAVISAVSLGINLSDPLSAAAATDEAALSSGRSAYHVTKESYEHPSGSELLYLTFDGVQFEENAKKPLDRAHQVCHATCLTAMLGAQCRGYCSSVDDDGDVTWITWDRLNEGGGTWTYLGGTGKYEGKTGGGTWTAGGEHGPNIVSNFWKRTH